MKISIKVETLDKPFKAAPKYLPTISARVEIRNTYRTVRTGYGRILIIVSCKKINLRDPIVTYEIYKMADNLKAQRHMLSDVILSVCDFVPQSLSYLWERSGVLKYGSIRLIIPP